MKKIIVLSVFIMSAVIIFFACTKENNEAAIQNSQAQTNLTQKDLKINNLIKNFKEKIAYYKANPGLKDGETVPADSALWYLEATINYSHAFPNEYYDGFEIDTSYLTVPVNGDGTVDMTVLTQKYEEMKSNVAADYHNSQFTEKGLSYVNLEIVSNNGNEMIFSVETGTGEKNNDPPDGPFGDEDYWWYGDFLGHCDPHTYDSDAAHELMYAINTDIANSGGNYFYTDYDTKTYKGGQDVIRRDGDPDPLNNLYDYYLYSVSEGVTPFSENMLCLNPDDMNTYYSLLQELVYTKIPQMNDYPPEVSIESVTNMIGYWEYIINTGKKHYLHKATFNYGKKIQYINSSPSEL